MDATVAGCLDVYACAVVLMLMPVLMLLLLKLVLLLLLFLLLVHLHYLTVVSLVLEQLLIVVDEKIVHL